MVLQKGEKYDERAVLVGLITQQQGVDKSREYLDELAFLCGTAGASVWGRFTQKLNRPDPKTFIGRGKLDELRQFIRLHRVDTAVFDDALSPSQFRNIETYLDVKVLDRRGLILDIFAQHARTSYARAQVALAQYECLLPRLTRMWTHLERQCGGIGMRGPGETEIETDRRVIRDKIAGLKKRLQSIDRQLIAQRKNRSKLVRVALVGYTNVGKSTLMNSVADTSVFTEDALFATLDTTVRRVVIKDLAFLLSDTVGFIRKLPTQLIESFKSTLDELRESDLLLHVIDISHPDFEAQITAVNTTLAEVNAADKPVIGVFNKIDDCKRVARDEGLATADWNRSWMGRLQAPSVFVSAREKQNIAALEALLYREVKAIYRMRFPFKSRI